MMTRRLHFYLLGCTIAALASVSTRAQEREAEQKKEAHSQEHASDADTMRAGLAKARISLAEAVLRANRVVAGDVLAAHLDVEREEGELEVTFKVIVLRDGELWEVEVNAVSGWVDEFEKMGLLDEVADEGHDHGHGQEHRDGEEADGAHEHDEKHEHGEKKEHEQASPNAKPLQFPFEDMKPGALPAPFNAAETNGAGKLAKWNVVRDNAAASGQQSVQVVTANAGQTFNVLLSSQTQAADLELAVKIRADSGKEDQGGGLVWRARDANNYYVTRWNPLERNLRIYKVENGQRAQLDSAQIDVPTGSAWHTIGVRAQGSKMRVDFDGEARLEIEDSTFRTPGKVGLWTKADACCSFDDLAIHPLR